MQIVKPEEAAAAKDLRTLAPRTLHAALSGLHHKLERIAKGSEDRLLPHEFAVLMQWLEFSVNCSEQRLSLMRSMAEQVPNMGYPKSAETMILALIENWFFEGDEKARTSLLESVRKSVLDKAPISTPQGTGGVRLPTDDQEYYRTEWGETLKRGGGKAVSGKSRRS